MKLRISVPKSQPEGIYYKHISNEIKNLFEADEKEQESSKKPDNKKAQKKDDVAYSPTVPKSIKPVFPMDFILRKFPELKTVLTDLLTITFKDYIHNIFVVAPKPTTFKVLLKNDQWFLLIYNERSYVVKAAGKKYYLLNLSEKQRAIQAIADLLITKNFLGSDKEENQSTGPDSTSSEKSSKSSSGGSSSSSGGSEELSSEDLDSILGGESEDTPPETGEPSGEEGTDEPISENFIIRIRK